MSVRSPRTPADWQAAQLPPELYARYGGSLELAPTNLFPSQYLLEVTGDNDPVGWLRPRPAREDGYSVYVTQAGAKQKTLTAQNSWPIPPEQDAWVGNQPIVNGMLPVRDLEFAANVVRLLAPRVSIEDAAAKGFTGGDYWCGEAYRDRRGRRTTPTGFVKVTVANGNSLKFPAATNVPEDAAYREILVSRVGKGAETARVQRVIKLDAEGRGEVNVSGPWRAGKLAAQTNQTKAGRAAKVSLGHQVRRVKAAFNLQARAFRFACQLVTGKGSSLVSEPTNEVVVQGDPELDENGNPTGNTLGYTAHEAFRFRPRSLPRGYRFVPWVQMDGVWYYAIDTRSPYPQIGFGRGWLDSRYHVPIYGYTQENAPPGCRIVLVQAEPPFEDTTGIEAPDPAEAIDAPTTYGSQVPVAGDYLSAVALSQNGRPGRVSPPSARFTLNGSQIFRVIPPKRVNILPNAELSERDAANNPRSWTINAAMAGGAYAIDDPEPGVLRLSTNGPISGTTSGDSPNAITSVAARMSVNTEAPLTVEDTIEVSNWAAGSASVWLRQFDSSGTFLSDILVGSVSSNGRSTVRKTFGPGYTAFAAGTTSVALLRGMSGATRNLTARFSGAAISPFEAVPRKVIFGEGELDDFDPPPATPHQTGSFFATGVPKSPPGVIEGPAPKEVVGFEGSGAGGTLPTTWNLVVSGGFATQQVTQAAAIFGLYGWNVTDTSTGASQRSIERQWTAAETNGVSLAERALIRINQLPTRSEVSVLRIDYGTTGGGQMAVVTIGPQGQIALRSYTASGLAETIASGFYVSAGEVLDVEVVVGGGNSRNGLVTLLASKNGEPRAVVATSSGLDFSAISPRKTYAGLIYKFDPAAHLNLDFDQLVITDKGDVLSGREGASVPAGVTPEPPSRPPVLDATGAPTGAYRETEATGEQIAQGYLFFEPGAPSEDFTLVGGDDEVSPPIAVTPGESYTVAVQSREVIFSGPVEPTYPFFVTLHNNAGESRGMGSPYVGGLTEATQQTTWTGIDRYFTFTVPSGFTEARLHIQKTRGMVYVFQEPLFARGSLTTQAARDAARGYGRATGPATVRVILPTEARDMAFTPQIGAFRRALGAVNASESGTLTLSYRATNEDPSVVANPAWSASVTDPALVPEMAFTELALTLTGDGIDTPVIAPGGAYLEISRAFATLTRADRSDLPGVALIGMVEPERTRPDYDTEAVSGHVFASPTTESVTRLPAFKVLVTTEEARRELEEIGLDEEMPDGERIASEWTVEDPRLGGGGKLLTIRFAEPLVFEAEEVTLPILGGVRYQVSVAEVSGAEVLEAADWGLR